MSIKKKMMLAFSKGNRTIFDKNGGLYVNSLFDNNISMLLARIKTDVFQLTLFEDGYSKKIITLTPLEATTLIPKIDTEDAKGVFEKERLKKEQDDEIKANNILDIIIG